jgi:sulfite reductase (NADPH) hemoprotein beta-component
VIGSEVCPWLEKKHLLSYLEAILRVYNQNGRRDNKYKRIKILVKAMGVDAFREAVEQEWELLKDGPTTLSEEEMNRAHGFFTAPAYRELDGEASETSLAAAVDADPIFGNWVRRNTRAHRVTGYRSVSISLKATGYAPGDITDAQLELVAELADQFSFGEMATPNIGYLTDMICCPGGDYCSLANAKSLPVAEAIQARFDNLDYLYDLGPLELNISGCMNACGHHHIGHIGILGVDKKGQEFYQVCLGGSQAKDASIGKILGPSFKQEDMPEVIDRILSTYVGLREEEETFLDTYRRVGIDPFKERVYAKAD